MAMTFLVAPASSVPSTSVFVYTRKYGRLKACCTWRASSSSFEATVTVAGSFCATSGAMQGPESAATRRDESTEPSRTSRTICVGRSNEPFSIPLDTEQMGSSPGQ